MSGQGISAVRTVSEGSDLPRDERYSPQWVTKINDNLKQGHTYDAGQSWTIYRVPERLRQVQPSAFTPKLMSIGPFHCKDNNLQAMNEHKMRYLLRLLGGKFENNNYNDHHDEEEEVPGISHDTMLELEDLGGAMAALEKKVRACYSESFNSMNSDEFVRMMVVDGCFVVELLRHHYSYIYAQNKPKGKVDPIIATPWMLRTLQRDLLMLENQLPFFVLEKLYQLINSGVRRLEHPFADLVVPFFEPLLHPKRTTPFRSESSMRNPTTAAAMPTHLLDFFRFTFEMTHKNRISKIDKRKLIRQGAITSESREQIIARGHYKQLIYHAVELENAGVRIQKQQSRDKNDTGDMFNITFNSSRVLEIPPLYIDDNTVPMFLNFIAYEQCKETTTQFFTYLFIFFDGLVDSDSDVHLLHKEGIINHVIGSDRDVATLINKLGREIVYDQDHNYLFGEMSQLNEYCKRYYESKVRSWWRALLSDYCSTPWAVASISAAFVLLIFTLLQTFYSVYGYYNPHK